MPEDVTTGDAVAALVGLIPGPWGLIGAMVAKAGVPFVEGLIANAKNGVPVTPEAWAELRAKAAKPFVDL